MFFQPQIWPQCETNRFSTVCLHYSMCPCTVASLVTEHSCLMFSKRPENGKGGCVCRGWCVRFTRVFFTSYSQTPSVPAKGLSHSYWPRCHPAFAPLPDIQREQWTKMAGERGGEFEFNLGPKALTWCKKTSLFISKKHFQRCWQTLSDTAATPQLTPNANAATSSIQTLCSTLQ